MGLNRESILALNPASNIREVEVPDVGVFRMRELSAKEATAFGLLGDDPDEGLLTAKGIPMLLALTLVDDEGNQMFKAEEAELLAEHLPARAFALLLDAAMDLAGIAPEKEEGEGDEDEPTPDAASFGEAQGSDGSSS